MRNTKKNKNVNRRSRTIVQLFWFISTLAIGTLSVPTQTHAMILCNAIANRDVYPVDAEDRTVLIRKGRIHGAITQYRTDKHTGEASFCSHGGYCYPAKAFDLQKCEIGKPGSYGADDDDYSYRAVVPIRSMFSPTVLKEYDTSDRLAELGLCSACADNAAHFYIHAPHSKCGRTVKRALLSNHAALDELKQQPTYCDTSPGVLPSSQNSIAMHSGSSRSTENHQIPEEFLGVWTQSKDSYCLRSDWEKQRNDDLVKITSQSIKYWEDSCDVLNVRLLPFSRERTIEVNLVCGGEGLTWHATERWTVGVFDGRKRLLQNVVRMTHARDDSGRSVGADKIFAFPGTTALFECPVAHPAAVTCKQLADSGRFEDTEDCYRVKAATGDTEAQFQLGKFYYEGNSGHRDKKMAAAWFTTAAERGHVGAQGFLGSMYLTGDGVPTSPNTAIEWYERAAKAGDLSAALSLAYLFKQGHYVSRDPDRAQYWCQYYVDRQRRDDLLRDLEDGCNKWVSK
jgi:hypothetical protein